MISKKITNWMWITGGTSAFWEGNESC